jgi:hypothetical protein
LEDELTAKTELAEKLGLSKSEPLKSNLFQGDFGFSIDFSILIPIVIVTFLFIYLSRKCRSKR